MFSIGDGDDTELLRELPAQLCHGQRAVKRGQADDFRAGDVRAVFHAFGRIKQGTGGVSDAGLVLLTGKNISPFIGERMRMCRDGKARLELAQYYDSTGVGMLVQDHQLNTFVRTGLPDFVLGQSDMGKHKSIKQA
jgi:hypothetical protein